MIDQNHLLSQAARNMPGVIYQFVRKTDGNIAFPYISERCQEFFGLIPEGCRAKEFLF